MHQGRKEGRKEKLLLPCIFYSSSPSFVCYHRHRRLRRRLLNRHCHCQVSQFSLSSYITVYRRRIIVIFLAPEAFHILWPPHHHHHFLLHTHTHTKVPFFPSLRRRPNLNITIHISLCPSVFSSLLLRIFFIQHLVSLVVGSRSQKKESLDCVCALRESYSCVISSIEYTILREVIALKKNPRSASPEGQDARDRGCSQQRSTRATRS